MSAATVPGLEAARARVWEFKASGSCVDCGGRFHPCAMQLDHVRGEKAIDFSRFATRADRVVRHKSLAEATWAEIEVELAKCDLVCANCHALRGHRRRQRRRRALVLR